MKSYVLCYCARLTRVFAIIKSVRKFLIAYKSEQMNSSWFCDQRSFYFTWLLVCFCFSFAEIEVGLVFILLVILWFARDPGFAPGYASLFKKGSVNTLTFRVYFRLTIRNGLLQFVFLMPARIDFKRKPMAPR
jgi:hypothetical protein